MTLNPPKVDPITLLPSKITFSVTDDDIARGCVYSATNCPIALAIARELTKLGLPWNFIPEVDRYSIRILILDSKSRFVIRRKEYSTSDKITRFTLDFDDRSGEAKPFEEAIYAI